MRSKYLLKILFFSLIIAIIPQIFQERLIIEKANNLENTSEYFAPKIEKAREKEIVIGKIARDPDKKIGRYQPFADYLAANLSEFGIAKGKVKIYHDIRGAIAAIETGEIDIFFANPYSAAIAIETTGAKPILRHWQRGKLDEYTVLIARKNRGINSLSDLKGKTIGLRERFSTYGYLLPMDILLEAELLPVANFSANTEVKQPEVRYIFGRSSKNVIEWVISGKVDAGAVSNFALQRIRSQEIRNCIVILAETEKLPRQLVLVRADLDLETVKEIENLLLNIDRTQAGKAVLKKLKKSDRFDRPTIENLSRIEKLYDRIPYRR